MIIRMPSTILAVLLSATIYTGNVNLILCEARKSSSGGNNGRSVPSRRARSGSVSTPRNNSRRLSSNARSSTRRKAPVVVNEYDDVTEDEEDQFELSDDRSDDDEELSDSQGYDQDIGDEYDDGDGIDDDEYDDFEQEKERPRQRGSQSRSARRVAPSKASSSSTSRLSQSRSRPSQTSSRTSRSSRSSSRRVVPYVNIPPPSTFSRGLTALRKSIPNSQYIKGTLTSAREATTQLSSNLYREVKGLSSSELEQVFLKVTIPNDLPVKDKHLERLLKTTYQSARFDIYSSALRKLWSKMAESDWRTTIKAVYVLHRYSTDGAREHQPALKQRLREMRRTKDPKKKAKYFNTKQLLQGDSNPKNKPFRAFLARYAHYVLLRVQCFGGMFSEISEAAPINKNSSRSASLSSSSKARCSLSSENITSTRLKKEHLDVAKLVLKDGLACMMRPEEVCEITAHAIERVASDMIGLTTAVGIALNYALKNYDDPNDMLLDKALIKLWCKFYLLELLPETSAMIKSVTPILDAYGLLLPSKMGTTVSEDLLQKGIDYDIKKLGYKQEMLNQEDQGGTSDVSNSNKENGEGNISSQDRIDTTSGEVEDRNTIDEQESEYEYEYDIEYEQKSDTDFK